jgi:hypothetical protein
VIPEQQAHRGFKALPVLPAPLELKAIPGQQARRARKVIQELLAHKGLKVLPAQQARRGLKVLQGRKAIPAQREHRVQKVIPEPQGPQAQHHPYQAISIKLQQSTLMQHNL